MSSDARGGRGPSQGRVGSVINGKWQIDARLGSGGMATVYSATHRNGHRAALKMLHTTLSRDPSTRARFLREGYVANAVGHPGVVGVLDDGVAEDGAAFLVLELLEGETIDARRIRLGGALPIDEALDLADQALDALAAAHEKGIIHRDIKPENVFFTNENRIKLLDFGLARMKDAQMEATKTGVTIGTPEFMPPEQALGRRDEVDARSDVWGLGATLFTAITGRYVHDDATSLHEQLIASATRRSPPIRSLAPHVSREVAAVIDRALELEMNDRWQSAREMQEALRDARGAPSDDFTLDSATVQTASGGPSTSASPFSAEKPTSSDQTMKMADAPPIQPAVAAQVLGVPRSRVPTGGGERGERGERKNIEDQSDIEETFIEKTRLAMPAAQPVSRMPQSTPTAPHTSRMRDRPDSNKLPALPRPSNPPPPPPGPQAFRSPILTPSGDHATVPQLSSQNPSVASPHAFLSDRNSPQAHMIASPRSFPHDSPHAFLLQQQQQQQQRETPVDAHGATVAVASPGTFRASAPPPAFVAHNAPPNNPNHPNMGSSPHHAVPGSMGMQPGPRPSAPPPAPNAPVHPGANPASSRIFIWVAIVFLILAAAMALWVLRRGGTRGAGGGGGGVGADPPTQTQPR